MNRVLLRSTFRIKSFTVNFDRYLQPYWNKIWLNHIVSYNSVERYFQLIIGIFLYIWRYGYGLVIIFISQNSKCLVFAPKKKPGTCNMFVKFYISTL